MPAAATPLPADDRDFCGAEAGAACRLRSRRIRRTRAQRRRHRWRWPGRIPGGGQGGRAGGTAPTTGGARRRQRRPRAARLQADAAGDRVAPGITGSRSGTGSSTSRQWWLAGRGSGRRRSDGGATVHRTAVVRAERSGGGRGGFNGGGRGGFDPNMTPEERRKRMEERMAAMTPEERAAFQERMAQRAAQGGGRGGSGGGQGQGGFGGGQGQGGGRGGFNGAPGQGNGSNPQREREPSRRQSGTNRNRSRCQHPAGGGGRNDDRLAVWTAPIGRDSRRGVAL